MVLAPSCHAAHGGGHQRHAVTKELRELSWDDPDDEAASGPRIPRGIEIYEILARFFLRRVETVQGT